MSTLGGFVTVESVCTGGGELKKFIRSLQYGDHADVLVRGKWEVCEVQYKGSLSISFSKPEKGLLMGREIKVDAKDVLRRVAPPCTKSVGETAPSSQSNAVNGLAGSPTSTSSGPLGVGSHVLVTQPVTKEQKGTSGTSAVSPRSLLQPALVSQALPGGKFRCRLLLGGAEVEVVREELVHSGAGRLGGGGGAGGVFGVTNWQSMLLSGLSNEETAVVDYLFAMCLTLKNRVQECVLQPHKLIEEALAHSPRDPVGSGSQLRLSCALSGTSSAATRGAVLRREIRSFAAAVDLAGPVLPKHCEGIHLALCRREIAIMRDLMSDVTVSTLDAERAKQEEIELQKRMDAIKSSLAQLGQELRVVKVRGDGNCLFSAVCMAQLAHMLSDGGGAPRSDSKGPGTVDQRSGPLRVEEVGRIAASVVSQLGQPAPNEIDNMRKTCMAWLLRTCAQELKDGRALPDAGNSDEEKEGAAEKDQRTQVQDSAPQQPGAKAGGVLTSGKKKKGGCGGGDATQDGQGAGSNQASGGSVSDAGLSFYQRVLLEVQHSVQLYCAQPAQSQSNEEKTGTQSNEEKTGSATQQVQQVAGGNATLRMIYDGLLKEHRTRSNASPAPSRVTMQDLEALCDVDAMLPMRCYALSMGKSGQFGTALEADCLARSLNLHLAVLTHHGCLRFAPNAATGPSNSGEKALGSSSGAQLSVSRGDSEGKQEGPRIALLFHYAKKHYDILVRHSKPKTLPTTSSMPSRGATRSAGRPLSSSTRSSNTAGGYRSRSNEPVRGVGGGRPGWDSSTNSTTGWNSSTTRTTGGSGTYPSTGYSSSRPYGTSTHPQPSAYERSTHLPVSPTRGVPRGGAGRSGGALSGAGAAGTSYMRHSTTHSTRSGTQPSVGGSRVPRAPPVTSVPLQPTSLRTNHNTTSGTRQGGRSTFSRSALARNPDGRLPPY